MTRTEIIETLCENIATYLEESRPDHADKLIVAIAEFVVREADYSDEGTNPEGHLYADCVDARHQLARLVFAGEPRVFPTPREFDHETVIKPTIAMELPAAERLNIRQTPIKPIEFEKRAWGA